MKILLFLLLVVFTTGAEAGDVSSNFNFTVTLESGCLISANTNLTINHSVTNEQSNGSFTVTHACTSGTAFTISLGDGLNAQGGLRRGVNAGNFVKYRLFWDPERTSEIGVGTGNAQNGTGTGNSVTTTIYASVSSADNNPTPPHGTYADTLRFLITW